MDCKREFKKGVIIGAIFAVLFFCFVLPISTLRIIPQDQNVNIGDEYVDDGKTMGYMLGLNITNALHVTGNVDTSTCGDYEVKYFFLGKSAIKTVHVSDFLEPQLLLLGDSEIYVDSLEQYVEPGYVAYDKYDGDLTEKVTVSDFAELASGNGSIVYKLTYRVQDSSSNLAVAERTIVKNYVGTVCLTFDDGPSSLTSQYLDILQEKDVKATFFVVGFENDSQKEELLKREVSEGHTIGLHGYSHEYSKIYTSLDVLMDNFSKVGDLVKSITGYESQLVRFPGGTSNTVSSKYCQGIMTEAVNQITLEGYEYCDWNVDSNDAGSSCKSSDEIYSNVISGVEPGRVNVVLMHDSANHQATLDALEAIIDELSYQGYSFKAITDDYYTVHHAVSN
jgi:peptidoglycan/xylan/chitin deacetylase (PgdA/CDA1 family)